MNIEHIKLGNRGPVTEPRRDREERWNTDSTNGGRGNWRAKLVLLKLYRSEVDQSKNSGDYVTYRATNRGQTSRWDNNPDRRPWVRTSTWYNTITAAVVNPASQICKPVEGGTTFILFAKRWLAVYLFKQSDGQISRKASG
ncbi:hypothetical protein J6590_081505 [Homalodisca vitripennis]|nr:hypothetical protein J6590_081505 [Homalodisca vitripennis]